MAERKGERAMGRGKRVLVGAGVVAVAAVGIVWGIAGRGGNNWERNMEKVRVGMSKEEVVGLLGEPMSKLGSNGEQWLYTFEEGIGWYVSEEFPFVHRYTYLWKLYVKFSEQGKVEEAHI